MHVSSMDGVFTQKELGCEGGRGFAVLGLCSPSKGPGSLAFPRSVLALANVALVTNTAGTCDEPMD